MSDDSSWLSRFLEALARHAPPSTMLDGASPTASASSGAVPNGAVSGISAGSGAGPAAAAPPIRVASTLTRSAVLATTITPQLLRRLGAHDPDEWAPCLARACDAHDIDTPLRAAAFLANIMVETGALGTLVESLDYKPEALLGQWPTHFTREAAQRLGRTAAHAADQRGIAELAYGGRMGNGPPGSGDGFQFRGRGLIQLTGRFSYTRFATSIGMSLSELPAHLETRDGAADSAAFHWTKTGCNGPADARDIGACRRIVNGGENGLPAVRQRYAAACAALGTG